MKILCFDIGGTNIKYALFENGNIKIENLFPTRTTKTKNYILKDVMNKISEFLEDIKLDAIGISTAGVVDSDEGKVIFAGPTIPKYSNTKFKEEIEKKFNIKCFVENDVNSAAFGEYINLKLSGSMFCMTVGTGLGGAMILDKKIYPGNSSRAGEIGYIPFKDKTIQDYVSAKCLVSEAQNIYGYHVGGKELFKKARIEKDEKAIYCINNLISNLCHAILMVTYIFNPKTIVIGGGISGQGKYLENLIKKELKRKIIDKSFMVDIKIASLGNLAGIYGIYQIVIDKIK